MFLPSNYLTATESIALVRAGKLTVTQIALDHLARYEERDSKIHAWVYLDKERILAEARRLDAVPVEERGPLHGMMLGVKDMMHTKDMPTQHGSTIYAGHFPEVDAAPVAVCRAAGALIYGKTYTTEFATTHVGPPTANAWDQKRTPGGSSSGSGAAVADWQCHAAFGTQTAGSTIRPASFNGIFSFKPTWGAVSREGLKISSLTLDTFGVFARSIADIQLLASVLAINDDVPPPVPPKPLSSCSFAYVKTDQWDVGSGVSPELSSAWEKSKALLRSAGAKVIDLELPPEFANIPGTAHKVIQHSESRANFLAEYKMEREGLHDSIRGFVENRGRISRRDQLDAYDRIAVLRPVIDKIASGFDAIVTPSAPGIAPLGLGWTGDSRFCAMWTVLHMPCVNVPGFAGAEGAPVGLTLVAPRYEDERLLSVASEVGKVWVDADEELYIRTDAPAGAKHAQA